MLNLPGSLVGTEKQVPDGQDRGKILVLVFPVMTVVSDDPAVQPSERRMRKHQACVIRDIGPGVDECDHQKRNHAQRCEQVHADKQQCQRGQRLCRIYVHPVESFRIADLVVGAVHPAKHDRAVKKAVHAVIQQLEHQQDTGNLQHHCPDRDRPDVDEPIPEQENEREIVRHAKYAVQPDKQVMSPQGRSLLGHGPDAIAVEFSGAQGINRKRSVCRYEHKDRSYPEYKYIVHKRIQTYQQSCRQNPKESCCRR